MANHTFQFAAAPFGACFQPAEPPEQCQRAEGQMGTKRNSKQEAWGKQPKKHDVGKQTYGKQKDFNNTSINCCKQQGFRGIALGVMVTLVVLHCDASLVKNANHGKC